MIPLSQTKPHVQPTSFVQVTQDSSGNRKVAYSLPTLPQSVSEFTALPLMEMQDPFATAALIVIALANYKNSPQITIDMLNSIRGPQPLSAYDKQFLSDRLKGKEYKALSYFVGATPENGYEPVQPYVVEIMEGIYSYVEANYAKLQIQSGGADSARSVSLRQAKDGKWYFWEQFLLSDIRVPASENPWL